MLHNPNWKAPKPDVISLEGLTAWLRQQDPDIEYTLHPGKCLFAQYLRAKGYWFPFVALDNFYSGFFWQRKTKIPDEINMVIYNGLDKNFGAALRTAEAVLELR